MFSVLWDILCNSKHFRTPFRLLMVPLSLFTHCHDQTADTCNLSVGKVYSGTQYKGKYSTVFGKSLWKGCGEAGQWCLQLGSRERRMLVLSLLSLFSPYNAATLTLCSLKLFSRDSRLHPHSAFFP